MLGFLVLIAGCAHRAPAPPAQAEAAPASTAPVESATDLSVTGIRDAIDVESPGVRFPVYQLLPPTVYIYPGPDEGGPDFIALRTGSALANTLLAMHEVPKDNLIDDLTSIAAGLRAMGAAPETADAIDDLNNRVRTDAAGRDEIDARLRELLAYEPGDARVTPAWAIARATARVVTTNVVARMILMSGRLDLAQRLLRVPADATPLTGSPSSLPIRRLGEIILRLNEIEAHAQLERGDVVAIIGETSYLIDLLGGAPIDYGTP